jgi:hypothetical protein
MGEERICYRKLRNYKYQTREDYRIETDLKPQEDITTKFIILTGDGKLTIKEHYAWDGPSGPTIDTKNFMRGSLVHDALYQLLRGNYFASSHEETRKCADQLLKKICRKDGMSKFRAWYVYLAVRLFAKGAAKAGSDTSSRLLYAP